MKQPLTVLVAVALMALGTLVGCGSSTEPIESPLSFSGEVGFQGSQSHDFTVVSTGTIRVDMVRLQGRFIDGGAPLGLDLTIGLGIGRPSGTECATRYSVPVQQGGSVVLGLTGADFCVLVFDGGTLIEGVVAEYTVSVSPG